LDALAALGGFPNFAAQETGSRDTSSATGLPITER
jgi:hypothetical protein